MKFSASKSFPAASWLTAASIAQILCQFLSVIIISRTMSLANYGLNSVVLLAIGFLNVFFELGISASLTQRLRINIKHIFSSFVFTLIQAAIVCTFLVHYSSQISSLLSQPKAAELLIIAAWFLPFYSLGRIPESLILRSKMFREIAISNF